MSRPGDRGLTSAREATRSPNATVRLGVDLGGSKIEIVALDATGRERLRRRRATPQGDYASTLSAVVELVTSAERELALRCSVGVGTPGARSRATGLIRNANSTCLNGRPLKEDLEAALGREVRIENDANCFALSEATDGAAQAARVVFGVILGTGVGGGIVVDGMLLGGANAIAGEWGHNPLAGEEELPPCYCGRRGCVETFLSGPALARDHGGGLDAGEIVRRSVSDPSCDAALSRYETRLARALAQVINVLDPDVIVLGGGLSKVERLYASVPRLWGEFVFSDRVETQLVPPRHGDSSGVRGAARLWGETEFS